MRDVGFIGLGTLGRPMAKNLLKAGFRLTFFTRRPETADEFIAAGGERVATPAEVARRTEAVITIVTADAQVREVICGADGVLAGTEKGKLVIDMSTIGPATVREVGAALKAKGATLIDAPVSGGPWGAEAGTLAIMVGGSDSAVEKCREPFALMGSLVAHFGPVGAGTNAKIARNLITFVSFAAAGEAQRLAEAAGLDLTKLGDVVRHSDRVTGGAGAVMLRPTAGRMANDDGLRPIFEHSATLGAKDLHLAVQLADEHGLAAPFAELGERWLRTALGLDAHPDPS